MESRKVRERARKTMKTADVFVNIPVKSIAQAYTYRVPEHLSQIAAGWRVFVPFGNRRVEGFVIRTHENAQAPKGIVLKDIIAAVDEESWFSPQMIEVARWLADFYLCSLAEIMRLFMPGKSGLRITVLYEADEAMKEHMLLSMPGCRAIYEYLLQEGPQKKAELAKALPEWQENLQDYLDKMQKYRIVRKQYDAAKRDAAQYEKIVVLKVQVTEELLASFHRKKAQSHLLTLLQAKPEQSMNALKEQKVTAATVKNLAEAGLVEIRRRRVLRDSYRDARAKKQQIELTEEQQQVVNGVLPAIEKQAYQGFLLKGVTGSGKTQVYIELAEKVRAAGRRVIVLVPEIALTGQVVMAFKAYFPDDLVVVHSRLSLAERNDAIVRVRRGEAGIIIGARSALFTPAEDIGLIILDEEQDTSYKQDESPRYHARVVAEKIAKVNDAVLLLGSATPSLESYYRAKTGAFQLLSMAHRIGDMPLPQVHCVDMRRELRMGNRHIISRALQQLIESTIAHHQQVIIMLNRRGFSTFVMCRSCGEVIRCRYCGLPLVYHKNGILKCHHCDVREPVPDVCPKCGSRYIKYFGSGTEKLEQELRQLVPSARVIRMDRDTTTSKFAHQEILDSFRRGEYDILLGTQMVAKGHDIPNVTAVGVISADSSLNMPDFRAAERCFMLITQTAGRAGRHGHRGEVVIQTYNPTHYAVTCGIAQDYEGFFQKELALRRELFYPPYSRLVKLLYQDEDEEKAKDKATALVKEFELQFAGQHGYQAIGPAPAVIACFRGIYRFIVLIKTAHLAEVHDFLKEQKLHLRADVAIDIDPITMF